MNPFETIYRSSNNKWGYERVLNMINQQCIKLCNNIFSHINMRENTEIDNAKRLAEGKPVYTPKFNQSGLEQDVACMFVSIEQLMVLLKDTYPDSRRALDDMIKHWRYVTEVNGETEKTDEP